MTWPFCGCATELRAVADAVAAPAKWTTSDRALPPLMKFLDEVSCTMTLRRWSGPELPREIDAQKNACVGGKTSAAKASSS
jgi:hypothetical protein